MDSAEEVNPESAGQCEVEKVVSHTVWQVGDRREDGWTDTARQVQSMSDDGVVEMTSSHSSHQVRVLRPPDSAQGQGNSQLVLMTSTSQMTQPAVDMACVSQVTDHGGQRVFKIKIPQSDHRAVDIEDDFTKDVPDVVAGEVGDEMAKDDVQIATIIHDGEPGDDRGRDEADLTSPPALPQQGPPRSERVQSCTSIQFKPASLQLSSPQSPPQPPQQQSQSFSHQTTGTTTLSTFQIMPCPPSPMDFKPPPSLSLPSPSPSAGTVDLCEVNNNLVSCDRVKGDSEGAGDPEISHNFQASVEFESVGDCEGQFEDYEAQGDGCESQGYNYEGQGDNYEDQGYNYEGQGVSDSDPEGPEVPEDSQMTGGKKENFTSETVVVQITSGRSSSLSSHPSLSDSGEGGKGGVGGWGSPPPLSPEISVRSQRSLNLMRASSVDEGGTRGKRSDANGSGNLGLKEVEFKLDIGKRRLPSPDVKRTSVEKERAPEFVVKPRRQFVDEGQNAKFKVAYEGSPTTRLSWSRNGKPLEASNKFKMYEEGGYHYLEVISVKQEDSGMYVGTVQNAAGTDTASAELDVFEKPKLLTRGSPPPTLSNSLQDLDVIIGDRDVKLKCDVTGGDTCTVTWFHNGREVRQGRQHRCAFNGKTASLTLTEVGEEDGGEYQCVISNSNGEVTTSCTLVTQEGEKMEPPVFIKELQDMEVEDGDKVELIVEVKGSQPVQVYWMHNNCQVTVDTPGCVLRAVDGVHSLLIPRATEDSGGEYVCEAYNEFGDTDTFCRLRVKEIVDKPHPPEFLTRPKPLTVTAGSSSATFTCRVQGHPLPTVQWKRNGCPLSTNEQYKIFDDGERQSLEILRPQSRDAGQYTCHVHNEAGSVTHTCSLTVNQTSGTTRDTAPGTAPTSSSGSSVDFRALLKPRQGAAKLSPQRSVDSDRSDKENEVHDFRHLLRNNRQHSLPLSTSTTLSLTTTTTTSRFSHKTAPNGTSTTGSSAASSVSSVSSSSSGRTGGFRRNRDLFENRASSSPDRSVLMSQQSASFDHRLSSNRSELTSRKSPSDVTSRNSPSSNVTSRKSSLDVSSRHSTSSGSRLSPAQDSSRSTSAEDKNKSAPVQEVVLTRSSLQKSQAAPTVSRERPLERNTRDLKTCSTNSNFSVSMDRSQLRKSELKTTDPPKTDFRSVLSKPQATSAHSKFSAQSSTDSKPSWVKTESPREQKKNGHDMDMKQSSSSKTDFRSVLKNRQVEDSRTSSVSRDSKPKVQSTKSETDFRSVLAKMKHGGEDSKTTQPKASTSKVTPDRTLNKALSKDLNSIRSKFETPAEDVKSVQSKPPRPTTTATTTTVSNVSELSSTDTNSTATASWRREWRDRSAGKQTDGGKITIKTTDNNSSIEKTTDRWAEKNTENIRTEKTTDRWKDKTPDSGRSAALTTDKERWTDKSTDRWTDKSTNRWTEKTTNGEKPAEKDTDNNSSTVRTTDSERWTDKGRDRWTEKTTDRDRSAEKGAEDNRPAVKATENDRPAAKTTDRERPEEKCDDTNRLAAKVKTTDNERWAEKTTDKWTKKTRDRWTDKTTDRWKERYADRDGPAEKSTDDKPTLKASDNNRSTAKTTDSSRSAEKFTDINRPTVKTTDTSRSALRAAERERISVKTMDNTADDKVEVISSLGDTSRFSDDAKCSDSSQLSDSAISSAFSKLSELSDLSDSGSAVSEDVPEPHGRKRLERLKLRLGGGESGESEGAEELSEPPSIRQRLADRSVTYGGQAVLQCTVTGVPVPDINWSVNKKTIKPSRFFQLSYRENVAQLVVAEAFSEDEGEYTCTATNTAGTDSCSCYLTVEASSSRSSQSGSHTFEGPVSTPPHVTTLTPSTLTVRRGQPASFQLTFTGEPPPAVRWFLAKTPIQPDDKISIVTEGGVSTLTIGEASANNSGRYTVTVTNDLGSDLQSATLSVEDVPECPVGTPHVYDVSKQSVSLSWCGPAYDGGSAITHYVIEVKDSNTKEWTSLVSDCKSTSYHALTLKADTNYQFRVRAANRLGLSDPSPPTPPVVMSDPLHASDDYESDDELPFEPREVTLSPGRKFEDSYQYLNEVGKGKFGSVYKCKDKKTGKLWAAKVLKVREKDKAVVRQEVSVMNKLAHPKLLMLWDAFEEPRTMVLVMEFVGAGELFERVIREDFVLTERDCVHFVRQICSGVGYMHSQSILHLDLKPENVLCVAENSNQIKIIDFGLARFYQPGDSLQVLFGTPEFIAPEVVNYDAINFATDMWSIGVICYILLSGLSPFQGDNDAETLSNVTSGEYDFDDDSFDDISDNAKEFISGLLVKRKDKRNTIAQCEKHPWLAQQDQRIRCKRLNTDRLRCFMARRKWQKTGNAIRALGRMASLQKLLAGGSSSHSSSSSLSSIPDSSAVQTASGANTPVFSPPVKQSASSHPLAFAPVKEDDKVSTPGADTATDTETGTGRVEADREKKRAEDTNDGSLKTVTWRTTTTTTTESSPAAVDTQSSPSSRRKEHQDNTLVNTSSSALSGRSKLSKEDAVTVSEVKVTNNSAPEDRADTSSPTPPSHLPEACNETTTSNNNNNKSISTKTNTFSPGPSSEEAPSTKCPSGQAECPPSFLKEMVDCTAFKGDVVRFDVTVTGMPPPRLVWMVEEEDLEEDERHVVELGENGHCSLIVRHVTEDDEGEYSCRAINSQGEATCMADLNVYRMGSV